MSTKTIKIKEAFKSNGDVPIAKINHSNFKTALKHFFFQNGIEIEDSDYLVGEKESFIDEHGVLKYRNRVRIQSINLKIQLTCLFRREWEFFFEEIISSHVEISNDRLIKTDFPSFVLVRNEETLYMVPSSLAKKLDLEEINDKNIDSLRRKEILNILNQYKIKNWIDIL
jgi:hypothetical protein